MRHLGIAERECYNLTIDHIGDSVAVRKLAAFCLVAVPETALVSDTFPEEHLRQETSCDTCGLGVGTHIQPLA